MASRLNLPTANVTIEGETHESVRIQVRNNVGRLIRGTDVLVEMGVSAVRTVRPGSVQGPLWNGGYTVEGVGGELWQVVRVKGGCGCGGRKKNANPGGPNVAQGKG